LHVIGLEGVQSIDAGQLEKAAESFGGLPGMLGGRPLGQEMCVIGVQVSGDRSIGVIPRDELGTSDQTGPYPIRLPLELAGPLLGHSLVSETAAFVPFSVRVSVPDVVSAAAFAYACHGFVSC
jgi:hypothetical protein